MSELHADIDRLLAAGAALARRPESEVLAALAELIERWLAPASPWRREAEEVLAAETGLAPAMLGDGLPRLLEPLRGDAIARLLADELGGERPAPPRLIAHVLPGNVPALAASAICLTLAVRAAAIVKPAAEERWFGPLFARSLAEVDAGLAACVAVPYWPGGSGAAEEAVFARADVVEVSGADESVAAVGTRVRGRLVGRGARLSLAAVGREVAADPAALAEAAAGVAEDVAIWEQRGCLSPQTVLVEAASPSDLAAVAEALRGALDERARRWPPRAPSLDEKAAIARFLDAVEWGLEGEGGGRVLRGEGGAVVCGGRRASAGATTRCRAGAAHSAWATCLHRTVRVEAIADLGELAAAPPWLEGVGLAVAPERFAALRARLAAAGVPRPCRAGEMQRPDLSWKPSGIARLAAWVR